MAIPSPLIAFLVGLLGGLAALAVLALVVWGALRLWRAGVARARRARS